MRNHEEELHQDLLGLGLLHNVVPVEHDGTNGHVNDYLIVFLRPLCQRSLPPGQRNQCTWKGWNLKERSLMISEIRDERRNSRKLLVSMSMKQSHG